jgi:hypothetical protein
VRWKKNKFGTEYSDKFFGTLDRYLINSWLFIFIRIRRYQWEWVFKSYYFVIYRLNQGMHHDITVTSIKGIYAYFLLSTLHISSITSYPHNSIFFSNIDCVQISYPFPSMTASLSLFVFVFLLLQVKALSEVYSWTFRLKYRAGKEV